MIGLENPLTDWPLWELLLAVLVPVLGFVGVAIGLQMALRRRRVRSGLPPARVERSSLGLSLNDVQRLAQAYYKSQGHDVVASADPDQPSDLVVLTGTQTILVRCDSGPDDVGAEAVTELARARDNLRAQRAVLLAPGGFRSEARRRAVALGVELRDRTQIDLMRAMTERRAS